MKKIEFLSTSDLEKLAREFENPKTITESIMRRGITAELESRCLIRDGIPNVSISEMQEQMDAREDESDEEIEGLESEIESLKEQLKEDGREDEIAKRVKEVLEEKGLIV